MGDKIRHCKLLISFSYNGRSSGQVYQDRLIDGNDPAFDLFVLIAEDWMPRDAFGVHPHRGIETATYVIEGAVEHFVGAGNRGVIQARDAQWMTARRPVRYEYQS
jgi:redox-sensitive bicupin YhaK (pirin superfamily)